jgi:hypothetical protein
MSNIKSNECCVCMDNIKTHAFVPCGHMCICEECLWELELKTYPLKCPLCRQISEKTLKVINCGVPKKK